MSFEESPTASSRRTLVKGVVWSVPAIAAAIAAPAASASGGPPPPATYVVIDWPAQAPFAEWGHFTLYGQALKNGLPVAAELPSTMKITIYRPPGTVMEFRNMVNCTRNPFYNPDSSLTLTPWYYENQCSFEIFFTGPGAAYIEVTDPSLTPSFIRLDQEVY